MKFRIMEDETFVDGYGRRVGKQTNYENKTPVVALVQRNSKVRSFVVPFVSASILKKILREHVSINAKLMTDEITGYKTIEREFKSPKLLVIGSECVRDNVTTNSVEGNFGLLKRDINVTFHHVSKGHLHRFLREFDFRFNLRKLSDNALTPIAHKGFEGKRLMYSD